MATGDTLVAFTALHNSPPATRFATLDSFSDGSTPATSHPVLDFDPGATTEFADFTGVMPGQWDGTTAITVVLGWSSDATTGNVKWDVQFKSVTDDADDLDTKAFAAIQSVTATTASAAGEVDYASINFSVAQADSIAPNEMFILRVERDSADAADTMDSNDAELHFVEIKLQ